MNVVWARFEILRAWEWCRASNRDRNV